MKSSFLLYLTLMLFVESHVLRKLPDRSTRADATDDTIVKSWFNDVLNFAMGNLFI